MSIEAVGVAACWSSPNAKAIPRLSLRATHVAGGRARIPFADDGAPLGPIHGGPARLLVSHLDLPKSREVGAPTGHPRRRAARLLGGLRLPRPRRPVA